jgi:hypothetical protein
MTLNLTENEVSLLQIALDLAIDRFTEDATVCNETAPRLTEQFNRQIEEARALKECLANL